MHNLEVSLVCIDAPLAATLQGEFEVELARSHEITIAALDALTPWERFMDWFWYQLRSQL